MEPRRTPAACALEHLRPNQIYRCPVAGRAALGAQAPTQVLTFSLYSAVYRQLGMTFHAKHSTLQLKVHQLRW